MTIGGDRRRAGVSRRTVSYAPSGKRAFSGATRRRVQDVIEELNLRPNASARALKDGRTRTNGLVIPPAQRRLTDMQGALSRAWRKQPPRPTWTCCAAVAVRRRPRAILRAGHRRTPGRRRLSWNSASRARGSPGCRRRACRS
ncbi:LacI family DNA-binding transcriptional regulator [Planosporangium sp. 12N6]|uniref:LacI family DNA-binding transcriptional regulator n=1 Tax=Planosporangium spinosum TaxID=3402278 RepID=UPI003CFA78F7